MFCAPFLGSEHLSPESRNLSYAGFEVTAFISTPTSKFDVGRFTSKRQRNHILGTQQESLVSLSWYAGMWHAGAKAPVAERAFVGLKPSTKSLDVVKQPQKAPKVQSLNRNKPFFSRNLSRLKPPVQNFEEQLAVLERIHLQSQMPCNGIDLSEEAQVTYKSDASLAPKKENHHSREWSGSSNQDFKSPDKSFQKSLENQFNGVNSLSLHVDHSRGGPLHTELIEEANFTGHEPVWNEPFSGVHRAQSIKNHAFVPTSGGSKQMLQQQPSRSDTNGSYHPNEINGLKSSEEKDEAQRNVQKTDACRTGRKLQNSVKPLDKEDACTQEKNFVEGSHSRIQGSRATYFYRDAQLPGSMNGVSVNGSHPKKQAYGIEYSNMGKQASTTSMVEGMQSKESVDASGISCNVASVRMPVYRTATPLQRSLSDSIFYLESLGADCSRLFKDDPTAMKCTVKQLRALVCALERHGLKWNDFGRIFNLCPKVLHLESDGELKAVTNFLFDEVGLARKDFGKVIRRCPRLLVFDINEQLRPTLSFLRSLGYSKMGQVVSNNPTLISFDVKRKLIPKLRFLESLGFTFKEAASMVVRFPAIFNYSISDNLQPKYDYLVHEMGGRNRDLLAFPQYFGYSLETRIRPRHECIAKLDVSLSIQAILKLSDVEFNARFLLGGGYNRPLSASPETNNGMLQDCSHDSLQFASFEHPEVRVLVSV